MLTRIEFLCFYPTKVKTAKSSFPRSHRAKTGARALISTSNSWFFSSFSLHLLLSISFRQYMCVCVFSCFMFVCLRVCVVNSLRSFEIISNRSLCVVNEMVKQEIQLFHPAMKMYAFQSIWHLTHPFIQTIKQKKKK